MNTKQIKERLAAGQTVAADFYDTTTGKQTRIRVVKISTSRYGHIHLTGINGEQHDNLTADRISFTRG